MGVRPRGQPGPGRLACPYLPGLAAPAGDLDAPAALAALPRLPEQSGVIRNRFARLADLPAWTPSLTTLRPPATPGEVPAALASLAEAGVRQYATHGYGSPVLLVHVATAPNSSTHPANRTARLTR